MQKVVRLFTLMMVVVIMVACQPDRETAELPADAPPASAPTSQPTLEPTPEPSPTPEPTLLAQGTDGAPWWNDTVFYQVFVRSFYDSDGDGVGDINGLIEKLDYLNDGDPTTDDDLGVTGIWLMPINESPSYHGYDVVDYFTVDQEYGTNEDFQRLMEAAHARGIRVIIDLVINHTGRDHPWFQEARGARDAEKRDWYVWADADPGYKGPEGQKVWHCIPNGCYYGVFWDGMPDLNFENPEVTDAIYDITRFWLEEMGVDGFRLDAVKHLIENGPLQEFTGATYAWFEDYYAFYKSVNPDAFTVGEAWGPTRQVVRFTGDKVDVAFEFDLAQAILSSVRSRDISGRSQIQKIQSDVVRDYPPGQYATFLANHDQDRAFSQLDEDVEKAMLAATWQLTSPGVPFIYYGEEIGMTGVRTGNTDEPRRLPMQWSAEANAGFTTGRPWSAPARDYTVRNVAALENDPDSLLNHYRQLIRLRNASPALRIGDWLPVDSGSRRVYAYLRHHGDETLLMLLNLHSEPVSDYSLKLDEGPLTGGVTATLLLGDGTPGAPLVNGAGGFEEYMPFETLPPKAGYVIQLAP